MSADQSWKFSCPFTVRDYELDMQGIVNNANYQHYYEHARHLYLKAVGLDFARLHEEGTDAIVYRVEIDYVQSLRSGDQFDVVLRVEQESALKIVFYQEIRKSPSGEIASKARTTVVLTRAGKPVKPSAEFTQILVAGPRD